MKKVENLSKMLHNLLECSNSLVENQIDEMIERYNNTNRMKDVYSQGINSESTEREISKQELFKNQS